MTYEEKTVLTSSTGIEYILPPEVENLKVIPTAFIDYQAMLVGAIGLVVFSVWTAISYVIALCTGRGEAWR
jgi:hypothetical protein